MAFGNDAEDSAMAELMGSTPAAPDIDAELASLMALTPAVEVKDTFQAAPIDIMDELAYPATSPNAEMQALMGEVERPELDTGDSDEIGFLSSAGAGFSSLYTNTVQLPASWLANTTAELAESLFPDSDITRALRESANEEELSFQDSVDEDRNQPMSATLQNLAEADSFGTFTDTFLESEEKWKVVKEVLGSSVAYSSVLAATAPLHLARAGMASYMMTFGDTYVGAKNEGKSDDEAWDEAFVKAPVQAVFDMGALKIADFALSKSKVRDFMGQMAAQVLIGGTAVPATNIAAGTEFTVGEMMIEGLAEVGGAPLEIMGRRLRTPQKGTLKDVMEDLQREIERGAPSLSEEERNALVAKRQFDLMTEILEEAAPETFTEAPLEMLPDGTFQVLRTPEGKAFGAVETQVSQPQLDVNGKRVAPPEQQQAWQETIMVEDRDGKLTTLAEAALTEGSVVIARDGQATSPQEEKVLKAMRRTVDNWVQAFAPDLKVVVSTGAAGRLASTVTPFNVGVDAEGGGRGSMFRYGASNEFVMEVSAKQMLDREFEVDRGKFVEVMAHEFGHGLLNHTLTQVPQKVHAAVLEGYRQWLGKQLKQDKEGNYPSINKYLARSKGAFMARTDKVRGMDRKQLPAFLAEKEEHAVEAMRDNMNRQVDAVVYSYGFEEFLANQLAKAASEDTTFSEGTAPYFNKVMKVLKRFYRRFKDEYGAEQSFQDYLQYLSAKTAYDTAWDKLSLEQQQNVNELALDKASAGIASIIGNIKKEFGADAFPEDAEGDIDTYGLALKYGGGLTHLAKENKHIAGLQHYIALTKAWWNTKMAWTERADGTLKLWKKLGRKRGERFGRFMLDLTVMSYRNQKGYKPGDAEFEKLTKKWDIGEEELAMYDLVDQDFKAVLLELEEVLREHAERAFETDTMRLRNELESIAKEMGDLRKLNFFPLSRYGSFFVKRVALDTHTVDGVEYKPGDLVSFEVYETKAAAKKAQGKGDSHSRALRGKLTDMQQQFAGMPPQFIRMLKERLALTQEQDHELSELLNDIAPGQSFKKHLAERKVVPGYNTDAMRGYASYFMHFSNHLGRIKFKFPFQDALGQVKTSADAVRRKSGEATKRDEIHEHLVAHNDYIMNPGNEMANLRALGFLWYLGFVPKSAVVNLTQVPLVTYPYLAARYGDAEAVSSLAKATRTAAQYFRKPQAVKVDVFAMLEELKKRGIIDESMATELAAVSEGSVAQRMLPGAFLKSESAGRFIRNAAGAGAWMFQQAEKQNRRVTAIAAFELAQKKGMDLKDAINAAEDAVETTQFEYARWNRPVFSQKKRSIFFLFWQYKTNALYFALRDPGNTRYLMMLLMMAGAAGLPFSEDIMDLVDWMSKKLAKETGDQNYKINTRQKIRELAAEIGANPDLILHGSSRYMFGIPALADMVGVPIPNVDMSGSITNGRMIPGIEPLFGREGEVGQRLAKGGQELGGAVLSVPINLIRAIGDDNPDTLRRFEKVMPSIARNFSKAYRYVRDEGDTLPTKAKLTEFDMQDSKHRMEVLLQAMGFAPTRASEAKEEYYMVKEVIQYWELQRRSLLELWDHTRETKDREGLREVKKAVQDFNRTVPFKGFAISGEDVTRSIRQRIIERKMIEAGVLGGKRGMQVQRDVEKAFPVPDVEEEEDP